MGDKKNINVYGDDVEVVMNGIDAAREATDADTYGEAVAELARAYTGWGGSDSEPA